MLPKPSYMSDAQPPSIFFTPQAPSPPSPPPQQPCLSTMEATPSPCHQPSSSGHPKVSPCSPSLPVSFMHCHVAQPCPLLPGCLTNTVLMPPTSPTKLQPSIVNISPKLAPSPLNPSAQCFNQAACAPLSLRLGFLFAFSPSPIRESLTTSDPQPQDSPPPPLLVKEATRVPTAPDNLVLMPPPQPIPDDSPPMPLLPLPAPMLTPLPQNTLLLPLPTVLPPPLDPYILPTVLPPSPLAADQTQPPPSSLADTSSLVYASPHPSEATHHKKVQIRKLPQRLV